MRFLFQKQTVERIFAERNSWIGISVVLSVTTVILSVAVLGKSQKIILVPPHITKSFWIKGDEVSKEYLEEIGVYMAKLLLDLSPANLNHNHQVLLRYATPEAYGQLEKQFLEEKSQYESLQLTTHFKPSSVMAKPDTLEVEVKGTLTSYVAAKEVKSSQALLKLKFADRGTGLLLESAKSAALSETTTGEHDEEH